MEVVDDAHSQDVIRVHVTSFSVQRKCDYLCDILLYCMTLSAPFLITWHRLIRLSISVYIVTGEENVAKRMAATSPQWVVPNFVLDMVVGRDVRCQDVTNPHSHRPNFVLNTAGGRNVSTQDVRRYHVGERYIVPR